MLCQKMQLSETNPNVTLTTYVLDDSREMLKGNKRPAVLICPGGAYLFCSDREGEPVAMAFAAMGYHAFVLRYHVSGTAHHPQPMRDIGKAILTIRDHAEEWLVDMDKLAICGFSAGGHNCAMYATNWHLPVMTDFFKVDKEALRPAAVILGYPVSDYVYMDQQVKESSDPQAAGLFTMANQAFLGTGEASTDLLHEVSANLNVTSMTPPTYLWSTSEDSLVPVQNTIRMAHALADHQVPFEMHIFESGPHGMSLANQATATSMENMDKDAEKWIDLVDKWLKKRFALITASLKPEDVVQDQQMMFE